MRPISLLLLLCMTLAAAAQQPTTPRVPQKRTPEQRNQNPAATKKEQKKREAALADTIPLYNGTYVGLDILGMGSKLLGGDFMSAEVSVGVNMKNKFIPTLEIGMGGTDVWSETGLNYKTKTAPFFRIGVDYNTMAKKKEKNSFLYVGLRYAVSAFKYDIATLPVHDPVWGDNIGNPSLGDGIWGGSVSFNHQNLKASMQWIEIVLGVQVKVYKNFNMGWSVRMKYKTNASFSEYGNPWYVPGYGKFSSNTMGLTYSLIYKLPL